MYISTHTDAEGRHFFDAAHVAAAPIYLLYLLYCYKSTHSDAGGRPFFFDAAHFAAAPIYLHRCAGGCDYPPISALGEIADARA